MLSLWKVSPAVLYMYWSLSFTGANAMMLFLDIFGTFSGQVSGRVG